MNLRGNAAAQRQLAAVHTQLQQARRFAELSQESLALRLGVSTRALRNWEKGLDTPPLARILEWARELGFRLAVVDRLDGAEAAAAEPENGDSWQKNELRRLTSPLRSRRLKRRITQEDLGLIVGVGRSSFQRWEDAEQYPRLLALIIWAGRLDFVIELHPDDSRIEAG